MNECITCGRRIRRNRIRRFWRTYAPFIVIGLALAAAPVINGVWK